MGPIKIRTTTQEELQLCDPCPVNEIRSVTVQVRGVSLRDQAEEHVASGKPGCFIHRFNNKDLNWYQEQKVLDCLENRAEGECALVGVTRAVAQKSAIIK
jgi:hypothetical protein